MVVKEDITLKLKNYEQTWLFLKQKVFVSSSYVECPWLYQSFKFSNQRFEMLSWLQIQKFYILFTHIFIKYSLLLIWKLVDVNTKTPNESDKQT